MRTNMRETTIKRHRKIRKRYKELLGTDTVMNIYYRLGDEFCMSVDRIRQIIAYHWSVFFLVFGFVFLKESTPPVYFWYFCHQ